MAATILIADNDSACQQLLALNLAQAGHAALAAQDAAGVLQQCETMLPDVLVLEWDLPDQSGLSLIRHLRAMPRSRALPIVMLSARSEERDKVLALEAGADDYVCKPFGPRETLARLHALLRRHQLSTAPQHMQLAGLCLDPATLRVTAGARQLRMGRIEFRLLKVLMHQPGRVHTRAQLLDQVWGHAVYLDERTVDAHVGRLRSALRPSGHAARIETVRGSGYRFAGGAWSS